MVGNSDSGIYYQLSYIYIPYEGEGGMNSTWTMNKIKKIDFVTSSIAFNNESWRFQVPSHLKFKVYGNIKIKCPIIIIIIIIIIILLLLLLLLLLWCPSTIAFFLPNDDVMQLHLFA